MRGRIRPPRRPRQRAGRRLAREASGNEDQTRSPVPVPPVFKLDQRVGDMLDKMDDDRPTALRDRDAALDAQEIATAEPEVPSRSSKPDSSV